VPQTQQTPFIPWTPFTVTGTGYFISTFFLHFIQQAVAIVFLLETHWLGTNSKALVQVFPTFRAFLSLFFLARIRAFTSPEPLLSTGIIVSIPPCELVACPLQIRWLDLLLFAFRLSKPHPDCVGATVGVASNLKFHFLPFSKGTIVHPLKLVAAKEELFFPLCLDEPKTTVCN
jgi:hypothetical protein